MAQILAQNTEQLSYLSNQERLAVYQLILQGCSHIYSKNQLQKDKALEALNTLVPLTQKDPFFLAHLTSYVAQKSQSKDLAVFTTFISSLSSADGSPFSPGSKYFKPNLRYISAAALHKLDPKLALRVTELARMKFGVDGYLNEASHFPNVLKTALRKYLQYREVNLPIMRGIKKAGLGESIIKMYRLLHESPPDDVAAILRWQQKDRKIKFEKSEIDFQGMDDLSIAKKIRKEKLPVLGVLGALPIQMTPAIAIALLEQSTGNQAVILRKTFEDAGVLTDTEVLKLYEEKIKAAKTALDRVDAISETASEEIKKILKEARAGKRKEELNEIGKVFLHLDASGSLHEVFDIATERGAIIAEMVNNPKENFRWGTYNISGELLPLPDEFIKDAFAAILFGKRADGGTDCFALYPEARKFGAEVDVQISDGGHNVGDLGDKIEKFHLKNPNLPKPKACVIIHVRGVEFSNILQRGYEANNIPVAIMQPESLTESALVAQAVKVAMLGPVVIVDEIMNTELLKLPDYYFTL